MVFHFDLVDDAIRYHFVNILVLLHNFTAFPSIFQVVHTKEDGIVIDVVPLKKFCIVFELLKQ